MSNLNDSQAKVSAEEPTRAMQPVDAEYTPVVRHRRSERRAAQRAEEEQVTQAEQVSDAELQETRSATPAQTPTEPQRQEAFAVPSRPAAQASYGQTIRIPPKSVSSDSRSTAAARAAFENGTPRVQTPRPKALDRSQSEEGSAQSDVRRPVNAPGYSRQEPLGRPYDAPQRQNVRREEDEEEEEKPRRGVSKVLMVILILLILVALCVLGLHLIPDDDTGVLGNIKRTVTTTVNKYIGNKDEVQTVPDEDVSHALSFTSSTVGGYAPADVVFTVETDKEVTDVQLYDAEGRKLDGVVTSQENDAGGLTWSVAVTFEQPFSSTVRPQVYTTEWEETGLTQLISVRDQTIMETSTEAPAKQVCTDILDLSASPAQSTAPVNITFSMTTNLNITQVRLVDAEGEPLDAEAAVLVDNASTRIWALNMTFMEPYTGPVRAQAYVNGEWLDSTKQVTLNVTGSVPVTSTPSPVENVTGSFGTEALEGASVGLLALNDADGFDNFDNLEDFDHFDDIDVWDDYDDDHAVYHMPDDWEDAQAEMTVIAEAADSDAAAFVTQVPILDEAAYPASTEGTETAPSVTDEEGTVIYEDVIEPQTTEEPAQQNTEAPSSNPRLIVTADESADPGLIKSAVIYNGTKKVTVYDRGVDDIVDMPDAEHYARQPYGVMTFRGSSFRQNAAEGTVSTVSGMEVIWTREASSVKGSSKNVFYGIGWTGQPLIVKWSKEIRELSNMNDEAKETKALREVIVAGEDGNIYFLNLTNGEDTRTPIKLGYPLRGTPSVHALGFPVLSVGQYARKMASGTGDIGMRVYNLLDSKQLFLIDGLDGKLARPYYSVGSFETSSLFDYNSDTMISAGTNGMLYLTKLNTTIEMTERKLTVNPAHVSLKTKAADEKDKQVAVESSMAAYQNYVFYADMGGILRCVDTSNLTTLWAVRTGDAVEAAVALDLVDDGETLWLYTANTLQNRTKGDCQIRRYDALTGRLDWEYDVPVKKNTKTGVTAGAKASPVIGQNDLEGLVYFTVSLASDIDGSAAQGVLLALDKETGTPVWTRVLSSYSYSSPVAVYNDEGRGWIVQAASDGTLELLDGLSGAVVHSMKVDGTINASPAVYKSTLVIGTQGKGTSYIYGISLK